MLLRWVSGRHHQSLGRRSAVESPPRPCAALYAAPARFTDTLELKASKENAHSDYINSVGFSPDGKTIVSGSDDKMIKVWDAGAPAVESVPAPMPRFTPPPRCAQVLWS